MKFSPRCVLTVSLLLPLGARAQESGDGLNISIRSGIDLAEKHKRDQDPAYAADPTRGRIFFLAHIQEEKGARKLVKEVDAIAMAQELTRQLEAQGFHAAMPGQKPEIVVTVKYGRGYLPNPYTNAEIDKQHTGLSNSDGIQVWRTHDKFVGLQERTIRAMQETLIIQVRAWEYPPPKDPKQKEVLLWMTTMHVDDPDHRDLNEIEAKMLAAGAPHFDRHIGKESEIIVRTAAPEGHVKVGTPEVVGSPKSN